MNTLGLERLPGRCPTCAFHIESQGCRCPDGEWTLFRHALTSSARDGVVHQGDMRRLIRGRIEPKHIGSLYRRAKAEGLIVAVDHERSNDVAGKNSHRLEPVYELRAA